VDVGEQKIAALLPPQRTLRRPERAAEAGRELLDRLVHGNDLVELGRELLDARLRLRRRPAHAAAQRNAACGRGHRQRVSTRDPVFAVHGEPSRTAFVSLVVGKRR
jgi:hypothetical protein